jgi:hypothetical protein
MMSSIKKTKKNTIDLKDINGIIETCNRCNVKLFKCYDITIEFDRSAKTAESESMKTESLVDGHVSKSDLSEEYTIDDEQKVFDLELLALSDPSLHMKLLEDGELEHAEIFSK